MIIQNEHGVTILILIDGFLQYRIQNERHRERFYCHNPYFNRWFSAISWLELQHGILIQSQSLF